MQQISDFQIHDSLFMRLCFEPNRLSGNIRVPRPEEQKDLSVIPMPFDLKITDFQAIVIKQVFERNMQVHLGRALLRYFFKFNEEGFRTLLIASLGPVTEIEKVIAGLLVEADRIGEMAVKAKEEGSK